MRKCLIFACVFVALASVPAVNAATSKPANDGVLLNARQSSCLPLPDQNEGQVRFFFQFTNTTNSAATFPHAIHAVWQRLDGSWKDSWLNTFEKNKLKVPAKSGKRYYGDFGADPSKPIVRCGYRLDSSSGVHTIRVLR
jgi:hypothetical protein